MRFISHIRNYAVVVLHDVKTIMQNGQERELAPLLIAQFKSVREGAPISAEEHEFAERRFDTYGRTYEVDEVTPTPLVGRLSIYDTLSDENQGLYETIDRGLQGQPHADLDIDEVWKVGDAQRIVERKLVARAATSNDFALFEEAEIAPPWPAFDAFPGDTEDLLGVLVAQGHHLPQVLAYEKQHQHRADVIAGLEQLIAETREADVPAVPGEYVGA
jgi:hypothetical protein